LGFVAGAADVVPIGNLVRLRAAAAVKRAARNRLVDVVAEHGQRSSLRAPHRDAYAEATAEWARLIRAA